MVVVFCNFDVAAVIDKVKQQHVEHNRNHTLTNPQTFTLQPPSLICLLTSDIRALLAVL